MFKNNMDNSNNKTSIIENNFNNLNLKINKNLILEHQRNCIKNLNIDKNFIKSKNRFIKSVFNNRPSFDFVEKYIKLFIPDGFNEHFYFSKNVIEDNNIIEKLQSLYFTKNFKKYYINCKYIKHCTNLNTKKCFTILRQLLRVHDYRLNYKETFINYKKKIIYNIVNISDKKNIINKYKIKNINFN